MNKKCFISVICPVRNEAGNIDSFIRSIIEQDYDHDRMEVILLDGMSTDNTRSKIDQYCIQYPFLKVLDNPKKIVPCALNIGIRESVGDYIIRLDAHCIYPCNYFSKLIEYSEKLKCDDIGGLCVTDVKNKTQISLAIKEVMSNRLGVGNSLFRTGSKCIREVDTVPFGCFRRVVFKNIGFFDERLVRNQDIELNKRIIRGGGKIVLVPEIRCTYFARETLKDLMKNSFENGLWNILTVYYTNRLDSVSIRHFIPLIFVLSLIFPALLAITYVPLILIGCLSSVLYLAMILSITVFISVKKNLSILYLSLSFFSLHFSYGIGSLIGLTKLPFLKNRI